MGKKDKILFGIVAVAVVCSFGLTFRQTIIDKTFVSGDQAAYGTGICGEETPSFLGLFDFSTAPSLLFYAYCPIILATLLLSAYLARGKDRPLRTNLLLAVLSFFVLWVLNILVQWVASYHEALMFAWQLTAAIEVGLYLTALYFALVFIRKEDVPFWTKLLFSAIGLAVLCLTPTTLNVSAYDYQDCEGVVGGLWTFIYYALEPAVILAMLIAGIAALRKEKDRLQRRQIALFSFGFVFFLTTFYLSNVFGEITKVYEFNLWGPLGMVVFFLSLGYLMVRFHAFNTKLIATEALVWGLVVLIAAQFFYSTSAVASILNGVALVGTIFGGILLIRSVKIEIRQKEELAEMLKQEERLEHLISHKVKGAFTRTKFIFSEVLDGTLGKVSEKVRDIAEKGLEFSDEGIESVDEVLNVANLKKGTIVYEKKPVDFSAIVIGAIEQKKGAAEKKGLAMGANIEPTHLITLGDIFWLKEVAYNLIDNAVKYTPKGSITVGLRRQDNKILYWVKDTGAGITDEDKKVLFTEGGRGKESTKVNVDSTGYGLFTVKLVVDGHGGRVWVDSAVGMGTTFYVELPLAQPT